MEFLNIDILWNLIWFLPLFFVIAIIASKRRGKYLAIILGKRYTEPAHVNLSKNKRIFRLWVLVAIIVLLTIAAARPFWGYRLLPFSGSGRDILAVIDVSRSMLSKDIRPSRLAHAKLLLKNLIKRTPGDRYGIIAFAGSAFLECPLTIDRTSLYTILNDINVGSIPVGSTNIEKALISAIKAFKAATGGYKAIILITDGDELQGSSSNVINTLKEIKTPLFVVGIGDPSKPGLIQLPSKDGQSEFLRDSKGNLVKSKLNEATLKQLAKATNGIYIRSTAVDPGLNVLEKKISQLIPEKHKDGKMTRPIEKFQIPLLLAILLIFIWLLVGEVNTNGKRQVNQKNKKIKSNNKHMKTILLLLSFIFISSNYLQADSDDNLPPPDQLPKISSATTPNTQTKTLTDSIVNDTPEKKKTPIEMFNMGLNAHSKGELKNAEKHYTEAINLADKKGHIRSKAYQNMGVIHHTAARKIITQNPEQSIQIMSKAENLYKEAMRRGPSRNEVAINQQILLNDKKKAEEIIKRQKEMQKKRDEARKKVKEALDKQKQTNKNKQKQDKQKQDKQKQDKQKQDKSKEQRDADRKTQHAQKAVQDYKNSAKQNNSQKDMQAAQGASDDITKARKNQRQNEAKKAEENLKEALKKLGGDNQQKNNQEQKNNQNNNQNDKQKQQDKQKQKQQMQNKKNQAQQKTQEALDKQQQANKSRGKEKKQKQNESNQKTQEAQKAMDDYQKSAKQNNSQQDKQNAEKAKQNLEKAKQNQQNNNGKKAEEELKKALKNLKNNESSKSKKLPPQPKNQSSQPKQGNKKIDPKQAEALLKLMAQDEKSLKKELKKRQKEAYGNMPVDKDW